MLVLQNVVTLSVNLADNIMLGAFSETALSGVTTVNQVQFVFQQLLMALGDGLVIFGSQYWGKKETEPVRKIGAWAMSTGFFIACAGEGEAICPNRIKSEKISSQSSWAISSSFV